MPHLPEAISDMVEKVCALNNTSGAYIESDGIGIYDIIDKFARFKVWEKSAANILKKQSRSLAEPTQN